MLRHLRVALATKAQKVTGTQTPLLFQWHLEVTGPSITVSLSIRCRSTHSQHQTFHDSILKHILVLTHGYIMTLIHFFLSGEKVY